MVQLATLGRFHSQTEQATPVYSEEKTLAVSKNTLLFKPYDSLRSLEATNSGNNFSDAIETTIGGLQLFGSYEDCFRRSLSFDTRAKPFVRKRSLNNGDTVGSTESEVYLVYDNTEDVAPYPSTSNILLELCPLREDRLKFFLSQYKNSMKEKDIAVCLGYLALRNESLFASDVWKDTAEGNFSNTLVLSQFLKFVLNSSDYESSYEESEVIGTRTFLDIFIDTVLELFPSLNWTQVCRSLDYPSFYVKDTKVLENLVNSYRKATGELYFPAQILVERWKNVRGQLSFLAASLSCTYPRVGFPELSPKISSFESVAVKLDEAYSSTWAAIPLIDILLELAETEHYVAVRLIFDIPLKHCPETLLLSLACGSPRWNEMYRELLHILFQMFFDNHPNFMPVARKLYSIHPSLLEYGIIEAWKRNPSCLTRILDVCQDLKIVPEILQHSEYYEFSIDLAVLAARREYLNLEKWLSDQMKERGPEFFQACIAYLTDKIQSFEAKPGASGMIFNLEATASMFKVLHAGVQSMPPELAESLHRLFANYVRINPRMDSISSNVDASRATSQHEAVSEGNKTSSSAADVFSPDIEEETNSFFKKVFSSKLSVDDGIKLLESYKNSTDTREQQLFACTIHNLFDEYRFFPNYPERVLRITGELFGALVEYQLVSSLTLGISLRYVLEALRRPGRMTMFGLAALRRFRNRLAEWPQYCAHIIHIPHVREEDPSLFEYVQKIASKAKQVESASLLSPNGSSNNLTRTQRSVDDIKNSNTLVKENSIPSSPEEHATMSELAGMTLAEKSESLIGLNTSLSLENVLTSSGYNAEQVPTPSEELQEQVHFIMNNLSLDNLEEKVEELIQQLSDSSYQEWFSQYLVVKRACVESNFQELYVSFLEKLQKHWQKIFQLVLSKSYEYVNVLLSYDKVRFSTSDRTLLKNMGSWIGMLTLARNKPILSKELDLKNILLVAYTKGRLIAAIPFTAKVLDSCKRSKIFRPPNPWLMAILSLLKELYNITDLKLNLKFEIEVLCKNISVDLREIATSDLLKERPQPQRENNPDFSIRPTTFSSPFHENATTKPITFSPSATGLSESCEPSHSRADVMFGDMKALESGKTDIQGAVNDEPVVKDKTNSSNVISSLSAPQALYMAATATPANAATSAAKAAAIAAAAEGITVIPNLASYIVISPSLTLLENIPELKRLLPVALDRAVREIIQPVVERSCLIASITSRELVLKDFAMDSSPKRLKEAAYKMGQSLASSLALVTSKEPLHVALTSHVRNLLVQAIGEHDVIEQTVQIFCKENLNVGCSIIEKAAAERVIREIDENNAFREAVNIRSQGSVEDFYNTAVYQNQYLISLPAFLYPRPDEMNESFVAVYEDFAKVTLPTQHNLSSNTTAESSATVGVSSPQSGASQPPHQDVTVETPELNTLRLKALSSQEGLVAIYQICERLILFVTKSAFTKVSELSQDNEIVDMLRKISMILQRCNEVEEICFLLSQKILTIFFESNITDIQRETYYLVLELLKDYCPKLKPEIWLTWISQLEDSKQYNLGATLTILRHRSLIKPVDYDVMLARNIEAGQSADIIEFTASLLYRLICVERVSLAGEWSSSLESLRRVIESSSNSSGTIYSETVSKLLTYLNSLERGRPIGEERPPMASPPSSPGLSSSFNTTPTMQKEHVIRILNDWVTLCISEEAVSPIQLVQILRELNMEYRLDTNETNRELFFNYATELASDACRRSLLHRDAALADPGNPNSAMVITKLSGGAPYQMIDSYTMLVVNMLRSAPSIISSASPNNIHSFRISLLNTFLKSIVRSVLIVGQQTLSTVLNNRNDVYARLADPRPFYRLFSDLIYELDAETKSFAESSRESEMESASLDLSDFQVLSLLASALHSVQPQKAPSFAFSWLELISCRPFMPRLLFLHANKGWPLFHRLLLDALMFLEPYLKAAFLPKSMKTFFKGFLRLLLTLLHDVPEFLCEYCFTLCDYVPPNCIQLRNLILSAFPREMRLPDPFLPDLKVDTLPEMSISPRVVTRMSVLAHNNIRQLLDHILTGRAKTVDLVELRNRLLISQEELPYASDSMYYLPAINALVLYVSRHAIAQSQQVPRIINMSPHMDILEFLATELSGEGRYHVLNAIANQLRYPNTHTHYCSCVLLYLFADAKSETLKEQITRVLVERLIANRPHPWGLLVTFIELIKNPRYRFWSCGFVRCTPEIEKLFDNVARTCIANSAGHLKNTTQE